MGIEAPFLGLLRPPIGAVMPVLEASALETDPDGVKFLRDVLGAGMNPSANSVGAPDISERFSVPRSVCPINGRSVALASVEIGAEHDALAEVE
jgi:hypothetical protein